jgi:type IV pilus assembly protein PilB
MAIFEIMIVTAKIRELIFNNATSTEIRNAAISEGMSTLYVDGLRKAMTGVTTIEEVYRVAKRTEHEVISI